VKFLSSNTTVVGLLSALWICCLVGCSANTQDITPLPQETETDQYLNTPIDSDNDMNRIQQQWLEESRQKSQLNRHR